MPNPVFCGVGCAMVTPFYEGAIDYPALARLLERQLEADVDALIVCGTTGEPCTLSDEEQSAVIRFTVERVDGRVPVIAGIGGNDTRRAIIHARHAAREGADGVLAVTPYYNKTSRLGLIRHFYAVADATELPMILYNVPTRTGLNMTPDIVEALMKHPHIRGLKEASTDIRQAASLLQACGDGVALYAGNDDMTLPLLALGARGVISVAANVVPEPMGAMVHAYLNGDTMRARSEFYALLPLMDALFAEVNPIPVKAALSSMGLIHNELRLPLVAMEVNTCEKLAVALESLPGPK